jgi:cytoskeleton protein RodZ
MTEQLSIVAEAHGKTASTPTELKALREAAGLSIPGTAAQLRLAPRQVEALELGEWDKLPGIAFIKGALRSYGRLLSADLSPLIGFVDQQLGQNELKADRTLEGKIPERSALGFGEGGTGSKWAWVGLGLAGLAAVALFFGQGLESYIPKQFIPPSKNMELGRDGAASGAGSTNSGSPQPDAKDSKRDAKNGDGSTTVVTTTSPVSTSAISTGTPSSVPVAAIPDLTKSAESAKPAEAGKSAESGKMVEAAQGTAASTAAPGEIRYHLSFGKESWVEVKDASGERVAYGTQAAGSQLVLKGKAPFAAIIGNAAFVKIEKKDESGATLSGADQIVPMPKEMPQGIARLTIR